MIFDPVRRKYVVLTPEEWVRQNFSRYMHEEKSYPLSLTRFEVFLKINDLSKRCDMVYYHSDGRPLVLVECKAPGVEIGQATLEQAAVYNLGMRVDFLVVTNLRKTFACRMDYGGRSVLFLDTIPSYQEALEGLIS